MTKPAEQLENTAKENTLALSKVLKSANQYIALIATFSLLAYALGWIYKYNYFNAIGAGWLVSELSGYDCLCAYHSYLFLILVIPVAVYAYLGNVDFFNVKPFSVLWWLFGILLSLSTSILSNDFIQSFASTFVTYTLISFSYTAIFGGNTITHNKFYFFAATILLYITLLCTKAQQDADKDLSDKSTLARVYLKGTQVYHLLHISGDKYYLMQIDGKKVTIAKPEDILSIEQ